MIRSLSGSLNKKINSSLSSYNSKSNQPIFTISQSALTRIRSIMSQKNDQELIGVKISLTKKGCTGLAYQMDYIRKEEIKRLDEVVERENIKIVIDSKAVMAVIGTEMVFVESQIGSQFVFNNPNEKGKCGCGESFHI